MASYHDLLDAIARVRAAAGNPDAWMAGLSGDDLAVATNPLSGTAAVDAVLAKIRAAHTEVFGAVAQPQEGSAAEAIRTAETSLAQQNSLSAKVDLQVITAVLNAHSTHAASRETLDALQDQIEAAVTTRTDLDTPAGARAFQRYLIDKLRDIRTVVETAGLDATSKAALAAALASLYSAATPATESGPDSDPESRTPEKPAALASAEPKPADPPAPGPAPADPLGDPLLDPLLGTDHGGPADQTAPPAPAPVAAPMPPSIPAMPAFGGGGLPPASSAGPLSLPEGLAAGLRSPQDSPTTHDLLPEEPADLETDPESVDDPAADEAVDDADTRPAAADEGTTLVQLPDGQTITAPTPRLAAVITAAVGGTPIPEAFKAQGITIPPAGTAVANPVDATRLQPGDIGMLTDRHAIALGNGKAVFNNRIEPIASVTGPSFLGWEHPPEPGPAAPPTTPDRPTPTRPAVTAGPS